MRRKIQYNVELPIANKNNGEERFNLHSVARLWVCALEWFEIACLHDKRGVLVSTSEWI